MTGSIDQAKAAVKRNVSAPVVVSTALGVALFGAVTYFAVKSGIAPLKEAAKVAKGGK